MRKGILITRGAIIEPGPRDFAWSIALPLDASVLEVVGLMSAFGLYCEMEEGATELRLLPADFRPQPTAEAIARFYERGVGQPVGSRDRVRFIGDAAAWEAVHA